MPVGVSNSNDHRNKHRESLALVCLKDWEEVVIFEEAHGSICDLIEDWFLLIIQGDESFTWRCGPAMHLFRRLKSLGIKGSSLIMSQTSRTSRSSVRKSVSLAELAKGQYLSNPSTSYKAIAIRQLFSRGCLLELQEKGLCWGKASSIWEVARGIFGRSGLYEVGWWQSWRNKRAPLSMGQQNRW